MDQKQQKNKAKKKGSPISFFIAFLIVFLVPRLAEVLEEGDLDFWFRRMGFWLRHHLQDVSFLIPLAAVVCLVVAIAVVKTTKKEREQEQVGNSSQGRTSAAMQRKDPRNPSFSQPDPYCLVCDHTGEDHFLRDKEQRIRQLDEWLRIGLIDRAEYRVLRDRYERDL